MIAQADESNTLPPPPTVDSPYLSPWLNQNFYYITQFHSYYGSKPNNSSYLEYESYGNKGPFEIYQYTDIPKILNYGSASSHGIWDGGSYFFTEQEPNLSLSKLTGKDLSLGRIKDWYIAADWTYDAGQNGINTRSLNLFNGVGVKIDTDTPLKLQINAFARYLGDNYGLPNSHRWDGYRIQGVYSAPLYTFSNGDKLTFGGYTDYTFGSNLRELTDNSIKHTNDELVVASNVSYRTKRFIIGYTSKYFHHGGQNSASNGFGHYIKIALRF
ncbi:outer membrane protein OmpK [Trinickia mobilis]|uniref:outer membrane protein OmpK n=1 Tax=Trinickia mobilis TaxID=2816356 RepID=UPI001A8EDED0|nr:outer membrane protein OmpK [Trinickia mobilis]